HESIRGMVGFQEEILSQLDIVKKSFELPEPNAALTAEMEEKAESMGLYSAIQDADKQAREEAINEAKDSILSTLDEEAEDYEETHAEASEIIEKLLKNEVRRLIT